MQITVEKDIRRLRRDLNTLEKRIVPKATSRTLNRVSSSAKTASSRHISPQIGSRLSGVKRRIDIVKASVRRLWADMVAHGRPLPLIEFVIGSKKPTQQKGGKRGLVKAKAWGKRRTFENAFIAPIKAGSRKTAVYMRKTGKRLPVKMLFGPGIKQIFKQKENITLMEHQVQKKLPKEFGQNIRFYLSRMKR